MLWGFLSLYHMVGFFVRVIAAARSLARSQGMLPTCFTDCRKGGSTDRDAVKRTIVALDTFSSEMPSEAETVIQQLPKKEIAKGKKGKAKNETKAKAV